MSEKQQIYIEPAKPEDAAFILGLIAQASDALLIVTGDEINSWISSGHSLVAKNEIGEIIGHQGLANWPEANLTELRSAYVDPRYRGQGLNTLMKQQMITISNKLYPDIPIIGFTEAASKSRGILINLGFDELPIKDAPEQLFEICPNNCVKKTGLDCGCKIYIKR